MKIETLFEKWFSQRPLHERWGILAATLLIVICLFYFIALSPMMTYSENLAKEITLTQTTLHQLNDEHDRYHLMEKLPASKELTQKMKALELEVSETVRPLISRKIIATEGDEAQNLLNALSKPMATLHLTAIDHKDKQIILNLRGGFAATFSYLQYLDQLPWSFAFDEFHYHTTEYPNAEIIIAVHPLNEPSVFYEQAEAKLTDPTKPLDWHNTAQKIPENIVLSGIFSSSADQYAVINGITYRVGDKIENYEISQITKTTVYLKSNKGLLTVPLTPDVRSANTDSNGTGS